MKIIYISTANLPSRQANSIHVMRMCSAFVKNGHEVILLAPKHKISNKDETNNIFEFYNTKNNFSIKKIFYPKIKFGEYIYAILFKFKV